MFYWHYIATNQTQVQRLSFSRYTGWVGRHTIVFTFVKRSSLLNGWIFCSYNVLKESEHFKVYFYVQWWIWTFNSLGILWPLKQFTNWNWPRWIYSKRKTWAGSFHSFPFLKHNWITQTMYVKKKTKVKIKYKHQLPGQILVWDT